MERIEVGYVARAHGVRGELRVVLHNPGSRALDDADRVWIGGREVQVLGARPTTGAVLVRVEGIEDRTAAEAEKGATVEVTADRIELEANEFLLVEVVGFEVVDEQGRSLGRVAAIQPGPQDLLVIRDDELERLLPAVPELLVELDREGRRLVVALPEDLPVERWR